jgi:aryl-alcohol dehydrogenase-like predicted oxidoreductase
MLKTDQRQLGASGLVVPALGVGVMSWGERIIGYGKTHTREDVFQAYRACLDAGLNFFDTAEGYGRGESERLLGECRRKDGRPILITTKFAPASIFAPTPARQSPRALLQALDNSLRCLGVECIDLYQIHFPPAPQKIDAYMDMMAEAVRAGKVRAVGVSNFRASLMRQAHARLARYDIPLASNQVHYNLLYRHSEANGVLDACRELDVALIAYSPMEAGILTGKFRWLAPDRGRAGSHQPGRFKLNNHELARLTLQLARTYAVNRHKASLCDVFLLSSSVKGDHNEHRRGNHSCYGQLPF